MNVFRTAEKAKCHNESSSFKENWSFCYATWFNCNKQTSFQESYQAHKLLFRTNRSNSFQVNYRTISLNSQIHWYITPKQNSYKRSNPYCSHYLLGVNKYCSAMHCTLNTTWYSTHELSQKYFIPISSHSSSYEQGSRKAELPYSSLKMFCRSCKLEIEISVVEWLFHSKCFLNGNESFYILWAMSCWLFDMYISLHSPVIFYSISNSFLLYFLMAKCQAYF